MSEQRKVSIMRADVTYSLSTKGAGENWLGGRRKRDEGGVETRRSRHYNEKKVASVRGAIWSRKGGRKKGLEL